MDNTNQAKNIASELLEIHEAQSLLRLKGITNKTIREIIKNLRDREDFLMELIEIEKIELEVMNFYDELEKK